MRRSLLVVAVVAALVVPAGTHVGASAAACAWPMYGHDPSHSFAQTPACTTITSANVSTLVPRWIVRTADVVTASPAVVGGVVYVGAWDGTFYAVDAGTGAVRWTFHVDDTHPVGFGRIVLGMDVHTWSGVGPAGVIASRLVQDPLTAQWRLDPVWKFDTERDAAYAGVAGLTTRSGQGSGCGDVWSSPAVDAARGLVLF